MEYVKTTMIDKLLSIVAPHRCSSCGEIGAIFCESCKQDIISEPSTGCVLCAKPSGQRGLCGPCARRTRIFQAWCAGERRDGLKRLIDAYKFDSSRAAASVCAELLNELVPQLPSNTAVVSIPSASRTVRARGFDHMARIANRFAKMRGMQRTYPLVRASSATLHFLPRSERIKLGPSLFRLSNEPVPEIILLLDDIVTTGTTLSAAANLLRDAGAKTIYAATLARQPDD